MVKQLGKRTAVVTLKELGTNCWLAKRFVKEGSRCDRLYVCKYPERKTCQAVHAEIAHLKKEQVRLMNQSIQIDHTVEKLTEMLKK